MYMLYKQADADAEAKRRALTQLLGAAGGGAAGYLLTRYGLGLKGAGAGLAGAGMGAVAGAAGGNYLADYGKQREQETAADVKKLEELRNMVAESPLQTWGRQLTNPLSIGGAAAVGLQRGAKSGLYEKSLNSRAEKFAAAFRGADQAAEGIEDAAEAAAAKKKAIADLAAKFKGKLTKTLATRTDTLLRGTRGSDKALKALGQATSGPAGKFRNELLDKFLTRAGRAGAWGGATYAAFPAALTLLERLDFNPRRQKEISRQEAINRRGG